MPYCEKCGQAEDHARGECPYDEEIPESLKRGGYIQEEHSEKPLEKTDDKKPD